MTKPSWQLHQPLRIHVWYIYLQLVDLYGFHVGKYTIHGSYGNFHLHSWKQSCGGVDPHRHPSKSSRIGSFQELFHLLRGFLSGFPEMPPLKDRGEVSTKWRCMHSQTRINFYEIFIDFLLCHHFLQALKNTWVFCMFQGQHWSSA